MTDPACASHPPLSDLKGENRTAYALRHADPRAALERAQAIARVAEALADSSSLAYALRTSGAARCILSDLDGGLADLERAKSLFEGLGDVVGTAHVLTWLADHESRRGSLSRAIGRLREVVDLMSEYGDRDGQLTALHLLGLAYGRLHELGPSREAFDAARELAEQAGERHHLAHALNNLGVFHANVDGSGHGLPLFRQAAVLGKELAAAAIEATATLNVAVAWSRLGEPERALRALRRSARVSRRLGLQRLELAALAEIARIFKDQKDLARALKQCAIVVRRARRLGERIVEVDARIRLGEILLSVGDLSRAKSTLYVALATAKTMGLPVAEYQAHAALSAAYEAEGNAAEALRCFKEYHTGEARVRENEVEVRRRERQAMAEIERVRQAARLQAVLSELQVLKAQMEPHLLVNVLSGIATMVHRDPEAAEAMIVQLGNLLRLAVAQSSRQTGTLRDELEFAAMYFEVERLRMGRAVELLVEVDPGILDAEMPNFIVQPLVENAIRHGFRVVPSHGEVVIAGQASNGLLVLTVADNGAGLAAGMHTPGLGVSLRNVRERLRLLYGSVASLNVENRSGGGTLVTLRLPLSTCPLPST